MATVEHTNLRTLSLPTRFGIYFTNHSPYILSTIILICKLLVLIGLLITVFSDHWAKHPIKSEIHTGYKHRCSVHICAENHIDSTWLVDIASFLAIIDLSMECINIGRLCHQSCEDFPINTGFRGVMFFLTFVIADCTLLFGVQITSYVYKLSMGYAYICFMFIILVCIVEWILSLKRLTTNWSEVIYLSTTEAAFRNHSTTIFLNIDRLTTIQEETSRAPSNSTVQ